MARTTISATTFTSIASNGYNLTDSGDFNTLTPGSGNGVEFEYSSSNEIILKNDTGGPAVFTFVIGVRAAEDTEVGGTITDTTVTVADGKTHVLNDLNELFRNSDGNVYIDCDVAGKVLLLDR